MMPNEASFTGFCLAIRIVEGLGASATGTATAAIVAYVFPDNVGTAMVRGSNSYRDGIIGFLSSSHVCPA